MQELIYSLKRERMNPSNEWQIGYQKALINVISEAESMLEKEKEYFMGYGYECCLMTKQKNAWSLETLFNETFNTK